MTAVVAITLGVPCLSLVRWMVEGASTGVDVPALLAATGSSVGLALLGALATGVLAFPVAWLTVRRPGGLSRLLERTTYVGNALPGIVVALACVAVSIRLLPALYQTTPVLIAAYAILFMPLAVVSTRAALLRVPPEIEESARALGTAPAGVLWRVTVPLVARGIGAGAALVFLGVVTELTATLLLAPTGTDTLATAFWAQAGAVAYGAAAPYAVLMVVISAPAAYLLTRQSLPGVPT
jgi:iron(III) transport system permease protein